MTRSATILIGIGLVLILPFGAVLAVNELTRPKFVETVESQPQTEPVQHKEVKSAPRQTKEVKPIREGNVMFADGDATISVAARAALSDFATFAKQGNYLIEVDAFAASADQSAVANRRVSLKRAQMVRGVLMDEGLESYRILVRARGEPGPDDSGPGNRVDIRVKAR